MLKFDPRECIFYHIYPLGFCDAPKVNTSEPVSNRIKTVKEWIPHLKALGISALYIGPVFESGRHGYDTHDYTLIDSRLGSNENFTEVCNALRENGIHIILDGVFNHVGRGFGPFEDVLKNREASPYCDYFSNLRFDKDNKYGDKLSYDCWAGHEMLVKLNLRNEKVKNMLLEAVEMWIDKFHISGLRLDAADCIDPDFFRELRKRTKAKKPDFWLMGEITDSDDYREWMNDKMLHSITNYEAYTGFYSSVNTKNMSEIARILNRQFGPCGIYKDYVLYNFLDNHDVNRIASTLKSRNNLKNLYTLMYTIPGTPAIYYGSEWAIEGKKEHKSDAALRPAIDVKNPQIIDHSLMDHLQKLAEIRQNSAALKFGEFEEIDVQSESYIFARKSKEECKLIFINISSDAKTLCADYNSRHFEITLSPYSSQILSC